MAKRLGRKLGNKAKDRQNSRHACKYERQRVRTERNKVLRRENHLELHPNDLQSKKLYG